MADEYFFGLTLTGATAKEVWDPETKAMEDYQGGHKLIIKQVILGPEVADDEVNVVGVEAMTWKDSINIPIASLKAGHTNQVTVDLSFPDPPLTFTLLKGKGPVHICGNHLIGNPIEDFDEMDEMEEEIIEDEDGEEGVEILKGDKRKINGVSSNENEEEEDDEEEPKNKKMKTVNNTKAKVTPTKNNSKSKK